MSLFVTKEEMEAPGINCYTCVHADGMYCKLATYEKPADCEKDYRAKTTRHKT